MTTPERLTAEQLAELKRLEKAATHGLWHYDGENYIWSGDIRNPCRAMIAEMRGAGTGEPIDANAALIAAARNHLPALLEGYERMRELLDDFDPVPPEAQRVREPLRQLPPFMEKARQEHGSPAAGARMSRARSDTCRATGKRRFSTHDAAASRAEYLMIVDYRPNLRLYVYRCPSCHSFHLTRSRKGSGKRGSHQPQKETP